MTDHAKAARQAVIDMRKHYMETGMTNTGTLDDEIDALAAERDALHAYARGWEDDFREQMQGQHDEYVEKTIQQMREEHNVAHLFD